MFVRLPDYSLVRWDEGSLLEALQVHTPTFSFDADYRLRCGKQLVPVTLSIESFSQDACLQLVVMMPGGKGGFGSRLRREGQRLSHPRRAGKREDCRDLQGRRIGDVLDAEAISAYLERKPALDARQAAEQAQRASSITSQPKPSPEPVGFVENKQRALAGIEGAAHKLALRKAASAPSPSAIGSNQNPPK